ncbi:MAG: prepilin-type N-terminal cleavage/methylation domain-containing protein [Kiritimatiellia bacterium]
MKKRGFTLIELLIVIGIAAMLITMASTGFFGALRQESVTKSRNQLRDVILLARQQACILGQPHVVVCWNSDTSVVVGNDTQKAKQGKFALFQYVGQVWRKGNELYVPFGLQRDVLSTLKKGSRVISLADVDADKFAKLTDIMADASKTADQIAEDKSYSATIKFDYLVGGAEGTSNWEPQMYKVADVDGSLRAVTKRGIPLAVRASQTYTLPKLYAFGSDRQVFVFAPDGRVTTAGSVTAQHSVAKGSKNATFTLTVDDKGSVTLK